MLSALALSASAAAAQTAPLKIGYINSQKLISEAPGAVEARTTLEKESNKHRADIALAEDSLRNQVADYQKRQLVLSADARTKEEANIRAKEEALQNRAQALEQQMQKRQTDLVKPIMDRINAVLGDIRKEGGYAIILDSSSGAIVSGDPSLDLTDAVLAKLKAAAPATTAAKPAATPPATAKKP
jgi:outer membrane protein